MLGYVSATAIDMTSPHRLHVRVRSETSVARDQRRLMVAGGGDDDLIARIAVKGLRELATVHQDER